MRIKSNKNRRVCHITTAHPEKDIRIFYKECISLADYGFDVFLVVNGGVSRIDSNVKIVGFKKIKSRIFRVIVSPWVALFFALKINAVLYHIHDPELLTIVPFLRLVGKKVIYDIHENMQVSIDDKKWIPRVLRYIISKSYVVFEKFLILFANRLILAEYSYKRYYPKKSTIILNFPLDNLKQVEKNFDKTINFVYVGAIDKARGIDEMLNVFLNLYKKGYDIYFDIAGIIFSEEIKIVLNTFIIDNKLQRRIRYHGYINIHEVYKLLENAHIGFSLLEPRRNYIESFPTKVFDYMLFGIPIIATNFDLYKEYIEGNNAGVCVDYYNILEIESRLEDLLNHREKLKWFSESGRKVAKIKFLWKYQAKILSNVYDQILNYKARTVKKFE